MIILNATENDLPQILTYDRHISRERLARCIRDGLVYVLRTQNTLIGVLRYNLFWETIPFLNLLYIDEAHQNKDLGRRMMAHWERAMQLQGYSHVLLSTQADETAQFFYEKLGYRRAGAFYHPAQDAEELIYLKDLP